METELLTSWSIAHFLVGVAFGFVFKLKYNKKWNWMILIAIAAILIFRNLYTAVLGITTIGMIVLAAVAKGLSKRRIKFNTTASSIIVLLILIAWEFFEFYVFGNTPFGQETIWNRTADVVIGFGAFIITYFALKNKK